MLYVSESHSTHRTVAPTLLIDDLDRSLAGAGERPRRGQRPGDEPRSLGGRELVAGGVGEVRRRRRALGLLRAGARPYTAEEDAALRTAWHEGTHLDQLAARLRRSADALRQRAAKLGSRAPRRYLPDVTSAASFSRTRS